MNARAQGTSGLPRIKDKCNKKKKVTADIHEDEKDDARQMQNQLVILTRDLATFNEKINELSDMDNGDLTDQLATMYKHIQGLYAVIGRAKKIVPVYEGMNEAIPTSEYDYDLMKFYKKVQELEDENQHGEVAEMLVTLYGNDAEGMIIRGINGLHSMQGSIMPEQQKLRDMISNKYYNKLEQDIKKLKATSPAYTMKKEGFASDAQRKAAFASGYDPSKKKKKESMYESMMDRIEKDIDAGMSTDAIIGKYANRATTNTDKIRAMIQKIKFKKFRNK